MLCLKEVVNPKRARDLKGGESPGWLLSGTKRASSGRARLRTGMEEPRALMPITENLSLLVHVPTTLRVLTVRVPQEKAPPTLTTPRAGMKSSRQAGLRNSKEGSV